MQNLCLGCMNPSANTAVCPHCGYAAGTRAKEPYHISPGSMLGKYLIGRVLGYGGFGVTYIAYDTKLALKTAIKEYLPAELATRMPGAMQISVFSGERAEKFEEGKRKFLEEARRLAQFAGEAGIVSILDTFSANGTSYIVMEYLEGETLKEKLAREGKLSAQEAVAIMTPVLEALTKVHQLGIVHRDIAPDNIFLTTGGQVKLLDFGAARYVGTDASKSLSIILKQGYAPEEQYRSHGEQGPWSDVYACGATLYKMLTGEVPENALERVQKDELKKPSRCGAAVSRQLDTAIMNALAVKKEQRTQSAAEFRQQLLDAVSGVKKVPHRTYPVPNDAAVTESFRTAGISRLTEPAGNPAAPVSAKKQTTMTPFIIAGACCLVVLLFIVGYVTSNGVKKQTRIVVTSDSEIKVPDTVGMTVDEAVNVMKSAGLSAQVTGRVYNDTVETGKIFSQSVEAGKTAPAGSVIALTVCLGPEVQYELPNLVGEDLSKWETELREHFELNVVEKESNYPAGVICFQSQMPGVYDKYISMTLYVSTGMDYREGVFIPIVDYVGRNYDESVKLELNNLKIQLSVREERSSEAEKGKIIRQTPEKGEYPEGTALEIVVGKGPGSVTIQDYTAQRFADVKAMLEKQGIIVNLIEEPNDQYASGLIFNQDVKSGTLKEGNTITLYVAKAVQAAIGPKPVTLGNYIGRNIDEVSNEILAQGTASNINIIVNTRWQEDDSHPVNTIIEQSKPAGSLLNDGETLVLTYAVPQKQDEPEVTEPPANDVGLPAVGTDTQADEPFKPLDPDGPDYYNW